MRRFEGRLKRLEKALSPPRRTFDPVQFGRSLHRAYGDGTEPFNPERHAVPEELWQEILRRAYETRE